jgi:Protein of unknown function, DUF547
VDSVASRVSLALCLILPCAVSVAQPASERFDRALHRHVRDGTVDYPAIAADADFRAYVASLREPASPGSRADRLVYYMNAYNALAIQGILEGLSPSSFFGRVRFFKLKGWRLGGGEINLYDLERDVLIPLGEPRIHFSIVCASKSCPKLRSEAYTAGKVEAQMDQNAREFINDPARNRFERGRKVAHLSEIFKWYEEDFSKAAGSVHEYVAKYVSDPEVARELSAGLYAIEWIGYDWRLNGIPLEP